MTAAQMIEKHPIMKTSPPDDENFIFGTLGVSIDDQLAMTVWAKEQWMNERKPFTFSISSANDGTILYGPIQTNLFPTSVRFPQISLGRFSDWEDNLPLRFDISITVGSITRTHTSYFYSPRSLSVLLSTQAPLGSEDEGRLYKAEYPFEPITQGQAIFGADRGSYFPDIARNDLRIELGNFGANHPPSFAIPHYIKSRIPDQFFYLQPNYFYTQPQAHIQQIIWNGTVATFSGGGDPNGGPPITRCSWYSDILYSDDCNFTVHNLNLANHNIFFRVQNADGVWSAAEIGKAYLCPHLGQDCGTRACCPGEDLQCAVTGDNNLKQCVHLNCNANDPGRAPGCETCLGCRQYPGCTNFVWCSFGSFGLCYYSDSVCRANGGISISTSSLCPLTPTPVPCAPKGGDCSKTSCCSGLTCLYDRGESRCVSPSDCLGEGGDCSQPFSSCCDGFFCKLQDGRSVCSR